MKTLIRIPRRYHWAYRQGQLARRAQLAAGDPDDLSASYKQTALDRAERDRHRKILKTMDIARRLTAGEDIPARWPRRRKAT